MISFLSNKSLSKAGVIMREVSLTCYRIQTVNRLEINWIKAHVGHPGNELAYKMPRESVNQTENIQDLFPSTVTLKPNYGHRCTSSGQLNGRHNCCVSISDQPNPCQYLLDTHACCFLLRYNKVSLKSYSEHS